MSTCVFQSGNSRISIIRLAGTTPATASTAVIDEVVERIESWENMTVYADLVGATGGTLDVRLQTEVHPGAGIWRDWLAFAQLASGAAAVKYGASASDRGIAPVAVGDQTTPLLASTAGPIGMPGTNLRLVATAGAGTSAGAAIVVWLIGRRSNNL